jgi:hypothetical protein
LEADPHTELETAARDDIDGRNILGKADRIVERHQQHAGCDADAVGAGGDRRGGRQNRGEIAVLDEVVLRQPDIIEPVVFAPRDLIEDFAVEPVGWLAPLRRVAEVIPKTKAYLSSVHHGLLTDWDASTHLIKFAPRRRRRSSMPVT